MEGKGMGEGKGYLKAYSNAAGVPTVQRVPGEGA